MSDDGTPCEELAPPPGQCSVGDEIQVLKFRITDCTCDDSLSTQDENFVCDESEIDIPGDGSTVQVSCVNAADGSVMFEETSSVGAAIEVGDAATALPEVIVCTVTDESGSELQVLTINTSGDVDLYLKDKFGVLQLESCAVENQPPQECIIPIVYTYTLTNVGGVPMNITCLLYTSDAADE